MAGAAWGGSEELWVALGKKARSEGHEVHASVYNWGVLPKKIEELKASGAYIHIRSRISYTELKGKIIGKLTQFILAENELRNFMKRSEPDVLIVSLGAFCDLEIDPLRKFLLSLKTPFYLIVHSNTEVYTINNKKLEAVREVCKKARNNFFVSSRLRQQAERQVAYDFNNSCVINNPVNLNAIGIIPYPESSLIKMACVGSLQVSVKGQSLLLQILSSKKWRNRNWNLNIYGTGPDEELIRSLIRFYELEDKVFLKGYVSAVREEIWSANHILLMPSYIEGMPISLFEAMLCGRTAVVTDVGGNREIIENNVTGYISEATTFYSFYNTLEFAWQHKEEWAQMGMLAYKSALEYYGADPAMALLNLIRANEK